MTPSEITRIQRVLSDHVAAFRTDDGLPRPMQIKLAHSLRVAANCRQIATELDWSDHDMNLGEVVGLLHDIGRFEQYDRFGTFSDPQSLDHAVLAHEIIQREGILDTWPADRRDPVYAAVLAHNRKFIPDGLTADSLRLAKLIRDADKIDIMKVIGDSLRNGDFSQHPEVLLNLHPTGPPTPEVVAEVLHSGTVSYGMIRTISDLKLVGFAWIRDINYVPALRMIHEGQLLAGFAESLPKTAEIRGIVDATEDLIARRVGQKNSRR